MKHISEVERVRGRLSEVVGEWHRARFLRGDPFLRHGLLEHMGRRISRLMKESAEVPAMLQLVGGIEPVKLVSEPRDDQHIVITDALGPAEILSLTDYRRTPAGSINGEVQHSGHFIGCANLHLYADLVDIAQTALRSGGLQIVPIHPPQQ